MGWMVYIYLFMISIKNFKLPYSGYFWSRKLVKSEFKGFSLEECISWSPGGFQIKILVEIHFTNCEGYVYKYWPKTDHWRSNPALERRLGISSGVATF